jgi:hypothetical protein
MKTKQGMRARAPGYAVALHSPEYWMLLDGEWVLVEEAATADLVTWALTYEGRATVIISTDVAVPVPSADAQLAAMRRLGVIDVAPVVVEGV